MLYYFYWTARHAVKKGVPMAALYQKTKKSIIKILDFRISCGVTPDIIVNNSSNPISKTPIKGGFRWNLSEGKDDDGETLYAVFHEAVDVNEVDFDGELPGLEKFKGCEGCKFSSKCDGSGCDKFQEFLKQVSIEGPLKLARKMMESTITLTGAK